MSASSELRQQIYDAMVGYHQPLYYEALRLLADLPPNEAANLRREKFLEAFDQVVAARSDWAEHTHTLEQALQGLRDYAEKQR